MQVLFGCAIVITTEIIVQLSSQQNKIWCGTDFLTKTCPSNKCRRLTLESEKKFYNQNLSKIPKMFSDI